MFKKITLFLSLIMIVTSCSEKELPEIIKKPGVPEKIYPVDFQYITLNHTAGAENESPSISYVNNDGISIPTYFKDANNENIESFPQGANQIREELFIMTPDNRAEFNRILVLDPNTFVKKRVINFGSSFKPFDIELIRDNLVLVVGEELDKNDRHNIIVGDLREEGDKFVKKKFSLGYNLRRILKVGDKIFVGGARRSNSKLVVFDIDNINIEGAREIEGSSALMKDASDFMLDKNGMIWAGLVEGLTGMRLCRINPNSEKIDIRMNIPHTGDLYTFGAAMSHDGKYVYIRSNKSFYSIDVDNPIVPDDPLFEYRTNGGTMNDLQFTKEGDLIFINQNMIFNTPSLVVKFRDKGEDNWYQVEDEVVPVGKNAKLIYVGKYEKKY